MSLATRCTSCGTAFRVVQDQLKVSEGWVRCGRCNAVFNALEGLFDLGRDAPVDWEEPVDPLPASFAAPAAEWSTLAVPSADSDETEDATVGGDDGGPTSNLGELLADPIDAHLFGPRKRAESAPKPAGQIGARDRVEFSDARFDSDLFNENASIPDTELVLPSTDAGALPLESAARPEFIRRADRRARWQTTPVRAALAVACVLAAAALVAQATHHARDTVAARWPSLRPTLAAWCRLAECRIEAPRRIDEVLVESTALTRAAGQDSFVLSVTLKNRSELALTLPSIDLTLTDANGRLVARRALAPSDFRAAEVIAPHAETALQVLLSAATPSVVGYTVEIFYP
jgi:predicted Zn finger-like uncharacterized protein